MIARVPRRNHPPKRRRAYGRARRLDNGVESKRAPMWAPLLGLLGSTKELLGEVAHPAPTFGDALPGYPSVEFRQVLNLFWWIVAESPQGLPRRNCLFIDFELQGRKFCPVIRSSTMSRKNSNGWKTQASKILSALRAALAEAGTDLVRLLRTKVLPAIRALAVTMSASLAQALKWASKALDSWTARTSAPTK